MPRSPLENNWQQLVDSKSTYTLFYCQRTVSRFRNAEAELTNHTYKCWKGHLCAVSLNCIILQILFLYFHDTFYSYFLDCISSEVTYITCSNIYILYSLSTLEFSVSFRPIVHWADDGSFNTLTALCVCSLLGHSPSSTTACLFTAIYASLHLTRLNTQLYILLSSRCWLHLCTIILSQINFNTSVSLQELGVLWNSAISIAIFTDWFVVIRCSLSGPSAVLSTV